MKKILFIINSLPGGGAEKVLYDILRKIDKQKYNIEIFLINKEGIYVDKIKKLNIKIDYLFLEREDKINFILYRKIKSCILLIKKYLYLSFPKLISKLKNKRYDIEIAFLEGNPTLLLGNRKTTALKIAWVHNDLEKHRVLSKKNEKKAYSKMNKIICVSADSKKSVENLYPELEKKIEVIYNPIPKEEILEKSLEIENIYSKEKINIVTVGRLNVQKGYDILLKAHNELLKEGLDYNLYILGEGGERKNLEKYISENSIEKNTFLLGFKENPYPYIKQADIFISSSRYEGYPLVICEAICLEKPIIATKCTGPNEILEGGKYGLLAEVESVESLRENMKKLILDEELRIKYSKLSKERSEIFDIKKTMKQIERVLDE